MQKDLAKTIGNAARSARKSLKITQEDAADRINVSVEFYARIERGTSLPSILTFARLVAALGVSADMLLGKQPAVLQPVAGEAPWTAQPPSDSPDVRRLMRRLRRAKHSTLRLVSLLLKEVENAPVSNEQAPGDAQSGEREGDDSEAHTPAQVAPRALMPANEQMLPMAAAAAE
jgi:transcriptional regulator with XRE-family HTH domain